MNTNKNKKTLYLCSALLSMLLGVSFSACSDSDLQAGTDSERPAEENYYVADPTDDQVEKKYSGKTAIIGSESLDGIGLAIQRRLTNTTTQLEDSLDAVLLSPDVLRSNFAVENAVKLLNLYGRGTTFIMLQPSDESWQKLGQLIETAEEQLTAKGTATSQMHRLADRWEMLKAQSSQVSGFGSQDAVALRLNDTYIVSDLQEQADSSYAAAGESVQKVTDYRYGKAADMLVEWLDKTEENQAKLKAGRRRSMTWCSRASEQSSLTSLCDAQLVTIQKSLGPTRVFGKTLPYEFKYEIYSMYSFDKDEEYYVITQHIDYHNASLKCAKNEKKSWFALTDANGEKKARKIKLDDGSTKSIDYAFGPYLRKSIVRSEITNLGGGETVTLMDPKPEVTNGSTTETTGTSIGLSGMIGFGNVGYEKVNLTIFHWTERDFGISTNLFVDFTFSSTESTTQEELRYTQSYDNLWTQWTMEGVRPEYHWSSFGRSWHEVVGNFQITDFGTDLSWYYRIEHPDKNRTYRLVVNDNTEVGELLYAFYNYELDTRSANVHSFNLTPPNRYKQEWAMMCSNRDLQTNLSKQLPNMWKDNFYTTALTEKGLDENMSKYVEVMKSAIANIADVLVEQGYTDRYTFYLYKMGDTPELFDTFTMDHGVVE